MAEAKELNKVVRLAIRRAPCSLRALAREADVPHSTLVRIKQRTLNASPETARKLASALQRWGEACQSAASDLQVVASGQARVVPRAGQVKIEIARARVPTKRGRRP